MEGKCGLREVTNRAKMTENQLWRHRRAFAIDDTSPIPSFGEGWTPLEWREALERRMSFKLEFLNPTGSFKDRGSALLANFMLSRGINQ